MPEGTAKIDITVFSIFPPHRYRYKCQTIFSPSISGKFALCSQMKLPFFVAKHKKTIGFQQKICIAVDNKVVRTTNCI